LADRGRYMASREWRLKRQQVIDRAGGVCERCLLASIENVHHLTYERLGDERLDDLQGLCRPCHEFVSAESHEDPAEWRKWNEVATEDRRYFLTRIARWLSSRHLDHDLIYGLLDVMSLAEIEEILNRSRSEQPHIISETRIVRGRPNFSVEVRDALPGDAIRGGFTDPFVEFVEPS
jgi:hypothetical protein